MKAFSLVRVAQHHFFLTVLAGAESPSIAALDRDGVILPITGSVAVRTAPGGFWEHEYTVFSVIGAIWEFRFEENGVIKNVPVGDELTVEGDDIELRQVSSTYVYARRIPKEKSGEEYPTPVISNTREQGAALLLYPATNNPEDGDYDFAKVPSHIAYMDSVVAGGFTQMHANWGSGAVLRSLRPRMPVAEGSRYMVLPTGVLTGGGDIAKFDAVVSMVLDVGGAT